jgi:hypothetical protein
MGFEKSATTPVAEIAQGDHHLLGRQLQTIIQAFDGVHIDRTAGMLDTFEFGHEIHGFVIGGQNMLITDGGIRHGAWGGGRQDLPLVLFGRAGFGFGH